MRRVSGTSGMVTAELAVLLPALVLLLVVALRALTAGVAQLQCVDAARTAARSAARGDDPGAARRAGLDVAPAHADVVVRSSATRVDVTVRVVVHLLPGLALPLRAVAHAVPEQAP